MGFKTKPNRYVIDIAPTGRAKCRTCDRLVPKGVVRVVTIGFVMPGRVTRRVRCYACGFADSAFAAVVDADASTRPPRVLSVARRRGGAKHVTRRGEASTAAFTAAVVDASQHMSRASNPRSRVVHDDDVSSHRKASGETSECTAAAAAAAAVAG